MAELAERTGQPAPRNLFGHPIGLANLFGIELWELVRQRFWWASSVWVLAPRISRLMEGVH